MHLKKNLILLLTGGKLGQEMKKGRFDTIEEGPWAG